MKKKNGFTLVEVLITLVLFALLMTLVSSAIISAMRFYRQGTEMATLREKASSILNVIASEITASNDLYWPLDSNPSTTLTIAKADLYQCDCSSSVSGDLTVFWQWGNFGLGVVSRSTLWESTIVARNVRNLQFWTDPAHMMVTMEITVATDINDPNSRSYSLSTSVCRRGTSKVWEFGP